MPQTTVIINDYIVKRPAICKGAAHIKDTRLTVHRLIAHLANLESITNLLDHYDYLTRAQVHAAIAYYYDHQQEVHELLEQESQRLKQVMEDTRTLLETGIQYITSREAAAMLQMKEDETITMCKDGTLDYHKIAERWFVSLTSVRELAT